MAASVFGLWKLFGGGGDGEGDFDPNNPNWSPTYSSGSKKNLDSWAGSKDPTQIALEPVKGDSMTQMLRSLTNVGATRSGELYTSGQEGVAKAKGWLDQPASYWGKILSGNRAAMMEGLGPEISTIAGQFANANRAASQFAPRSGGRAQMLSSLPYQKMAAIQNLIQKVRPQAAEQMAGLGQILGQLGLSELGLSGQQLAMVLQALLARRGQNLQERGQNIGLGAGLGQAAGSLIAGPLAGLMSGGGGGAGAVSSGGLFLSPSQLGVPIP